jgi:hypothetical protein
MHVPHIHHPRKKNGQTEKIRNPNFCAFGQLPRVDYVAAELVDSDGDSITGIPLLHPSQGMAQYGIPFWAIRFLSLDDGESYTLYLKNAVTDEVIETIDDVMYESKHAPQIWYPLNTDDPPESFVAYGTVNPSGTPAGGMRPNTGGAPFAGTNPEAGTNWSLMFSVPPSPPTYTLLISVGQVPATPNVNNLTVIAPP